MAALMVSTVATPRTGEIADARALTDAERAAIYERLTDRSAADVRGARERLKAQRERDSARRSRAF